MEDIKVQANSKICKELIYHLECYQNIELYKSRVRTLIELESFFGYQQENDQIFTKLREFNSYTSLNVSEISLQDYALRIIDILKILTELESSSNLDWNVLAELK